MRSALPLPTSHAAAIGLMPPSVANATFRRPPPSRAMAAPSDLPTPGLAVDLGLDRGRDDRRVEGGAFADSDWRALVLNFAGLSDWASRVAGGRGGSA